MTGEATIPIEILAEMVESVNDAIIITSADGVDAPEPRILYVNPAFTAITGYSAAEAIGRSPRMLQGPGTDRDALDRIRTALSERRECREEILNYGKDGYAYWLDIHIVPIFDAHGALKYFAAIERDVTARRMRTEELERQARQDPLTGLANRAALREMLNALACAGAAGPQRNVLLLLDLDDFKQVNDVWGHAAGDALLQRCAALITACLGPDDFAARLGGDEFAVLCRGSCPARARALARRIIRAVKGLRTSGGARAGVGASAGAAEFASGEEMACILARADQALYEAKRAGKGAARLYARRRAA
ncbi:sensor domain-containing diguanylate cyclase [Amphiplicatus metriothermophilus]|uniref:PAS domain S-box-containing protein/diguanylate cyclase (GGDEF) domain-containing protein n=1 Tax=Amphiplicatus metriothermophilus TaxID=1519374 RepID=A0A239PUY3_9PROT|nr:GGDEF domain-containing protein [Amphiplicatus metriothermophilus]MBB5519550.1 diguanylate cyclase (GGDEF)-like protein/PAS domain S-box-containing protein [Amphiplicatus metriothermophilus]SNT74114.1 PAS domain S-box-containing protein/diguanylate cyclase (GGDEF) domain-containing protein [Amphiplicatus metriothermophilus]